MDRIKALTLKIVAIIMMLVGLIAMLSAWDLLLAANQHSRTVVVLEMGGVLVCMAGYFLRRYVIASEKRDNAAAQSENA